MISHERLRHFDRNRINGKKGVRVVDVRHFEEVKCNVEKKNVGIQAGIYNFSVNSKVAVNGRLLATPIVCIYTVVLIAGL